MSLSPSIKIAVGDEVTPSQQRHSACPAQSFNPTHAYDSWTDLLSIEFEMAAEVTGEGDRSVTSNK